MFDQIAKTINLLEKTEISINKSFENINMTKKYIKEGKGSLYSRANQMRELGAKTKIEIEAKE